MGGARERHRSAEPQSGSDVSESPTESATPGPHAAALAESGTDAAYSTVGPQPSAIREDYRVQPIDEVSRQMDLNCLSLFVVLPLVVRGLIKGPFGTFRLVVQRDEPCRSTL